MSNAAQKAILTAKIGGVLKDLMVQTNAAQVIVVILFIVNYLHDSMSLSFSTHKYNVFYGYLKI